MYGHFVKIMEEKNKVNFETDELKLQQFISCQG
jgi:hypothetical protein